MEVEWPGELWSRRDYLVVSATEGRVFEADGEMFTAMALAREAVASTALAHPEWDMDEKRTWAEWEAEDG